MTATKKTARICKNEHKYYKSSDYPICPICEKENDLALEFLTGISSLAMRALLNAGVTSLKMLSKYASSEVLAMHGIGKKIFEQLKISLKDKGLSFSK